MAPAAIDTFNRYFQKRNSTIRLRADPDCDLGAEGHGSCAIYEKRGVHMTKNYNDCGL
jgi:hypothetical protein